MTTRPTFSNANNWTVLNSGTINAVTITNENGTESHEPINPISIPVQTSQNAIAITTSTSNPKIRWITGGWLGVEIISGLTVGGQNDLELDRQRLRLDKINLIVIPSYATSFSLTLYPPYWFKDITWSIFEYIGTGNPDIEGKIDTITAQEQIDEINQGINEYLTQELPPIINTEVTTAVNTAFENIDISVSGTGNDVNGTGGIGTAI